MEQKCPGCGSRYTKKVRLDDNYDDICSCATCGREFTVTASKDGVRGTWLMTCYSTLGAGQKIELYQDHSGKLYASQKFEGHNISGAARVRIYADPNHGNYLYISAYQADANPHGTEFLVERIEMSPAMTRLAKQNQAMCAVFERDNTFSLNTFHIRELSSDIAFFLRAATGAEEQSKMGGCYVATAVYGSYDCPQVWTLRRFRDNTLAETWYGRGFIRLYYAVSPTLVKWFGETEWFRNLWEPMLDRMVKKLNEKGVEDTP